MRFSVTLVLVGMVISARPGHAGHAGVAPRAASPGSPTGTLIESTCPTLSWDAVEGAAAHEVVVYEVGRGRREAEPVIEQVMPGSPSSWTPSLDRCLVRGGQYAWSVRALLVKGASDWSAPSLFVVKQGPTQAELEAALEVVQTYLDSWRGTAASPETEIKVEARAGSISAKVASRSAAAGAGPTTQMSVDGGVEAAYFSGAGTGLTNLDWGSLTNVPPGFADGTDNDTDTDTLAALRCNNGQVAKSNGSRSWICADNVPPATLSQGAASSNASMQPSLAVHFMIALQGEYPNQSAGFSCASSPCLGEIRLIAGSYAPSGWAFCQGQLLLVSQHEALFSLLGTTYGGNGVSTFALPDLRGRAPIGAGQGPALSNRFLGQALGGESQLETHSHGISTP